jgi:SAM-dependent methyltransferase
MSTVASTFDSAAAVYLQQLDQGISLSGESADYFVQGRVQFLVDYLEHQMPLHALQVLDFGCGVGNACETLRTQLRAQRVTGLDCSPGSIELACQRYGEQHYAWSVDGAGIADESMDVVYTSGVFHHIEPSQRPSELQKIYRWLKPGGYMALFENNPWNPGTRWVMSRIPFDRDAQCLTPIETRQLLLAAGFQVHVTRSLFYFPRILQFLRPLEGLLSAVPLGAQYVVIAKRPA